jgi:DNA polymerase I
VKKETKKLYILDVSGYIFRAYYALPSMTNPRGESTNALFGFIRSVLKLFKDFAPVHIVAVFDGPDNQKQRKEIYEKYKAHRVREKHVDLPEQIDLAKEFCELAGICHVEVGGVEADDTMGSIAIWAAHKGAEIYLCTSDKDLCQLVEERIFILNTWKDNLVLDAKKVEEIYGITPKQMVDYLAIVGDASDNIPGIRGFGPKTAVPLLQEFKTLENLLANADKVAHKKQETLKAEADIALLSKRLATIYTDVAFPEDPELFQLKTPDVANLKAFYLDMGFDSLARELEVVLKEEEKVFYHLIEKQEELINLIPLLKEAKEIAFDVEATSVRPLLAELVGIGFSIKEREAYYVPLNGKLNPQLVIETLKPLFEDPNLLFIAHNAKYDLHVLANVGIKVANVGFDTILASYLLNSSSRRHSLDHLALQYFGKVKISIKELIGSGKKEISIKDVPLSKLSHYCCEDVDYTLRLKNLFEKQLKKRKLEHLLFDLELPLTHVLAKMERVGMFLKSEAIVTFSKEVAQELKMAEREIYTLAGVEFNISSPKQLSAILFDKMGIKPLKKTATGLSTAADVLELLAADYPIAEKILAFRTLEKLRSTYLETLPIEINPVTHRIHPTFSQFVAATGRLACQDPNLQNIPVRTALGKRIREAFRPQKKGWSYLAADYSQVELRLLAHLSEDPQLVNAFKQGEDIHQFTASLVFGIPLAEVSKTQRYQAKAINFGIIYGQQAFGLSQELGIDIKEALDFIEAYFIRYPKVLEFINHCVEVARQKGRAITMIGRERDIPEIHSSNAIIRSAAERLAINTPLQGSAADLIKMAMLQIDKLLTSRKMESQMVLQIHDELIFEAPDHELDELKILVKKSMESVFDLKVPLIVDVNIGKNWAEV